MKRNMDLVRAILLELEAGTLVTEGTHTANVAGYSPELVADHLQILVDAKLIEATFVPTYGDAIPAVSDPRLTWAGHEFVDVMKNDTVWRKTMKFVADKGGGATLAIVMEVGKRFAAEHFGLPNG